MTGRLLLVLLGLLPLATGSFAAPPVHDQVVPILGVTLGEPPTGTVANILVSFEERDEPPGLLVLFENRPGRFSLTAQTAIELAIQRAARAAQLVPDRWKISLRVPYPGVTIYGNSLSAMVALTVIALAKGERIPPDRVLTGAVTADGRIAPVGAVPLKVHAASEARMRRIVIPDELDIGDSDWQTPFLLQVSPVGSLRQAYQALTDQPLVR